MMGSNLNASSPIVVTFFEDHAATTKREETLSLRDLCNLITTTTAAEKTALPWLKLARFGETPTDRGSLRHNANVVEITGVCGDYDGERVTFDAICQLLLQAGVAAIVYTSPSNTEAAPRWRVLAPLSHPYPPQHRDKFMARLNGSLKGILSRESWTLSQSYYFGSVNGNPGHCVQMIPGTPIDLLDALDDIAIGRPTPPRSNGADKPAGGAWCQTDQAGFSDARLEGFRRSVLDNLRHQAIDGQKHDALLRTAITLGGIQAAAGFSDAEAWAWMRGCLPASVEDWTAAERTALWGLAEGRTRPIELGEREPHAPRRKPGNSEAAAYNDDGGPAPEPPPDPPGYAENLADAGQEPPPRPGRNRRRSDADFTWPAPHDFLTDPNSEAPELRHDHIPEAINDFVFDIGARMGVDPSSVALSCIVACASVAHDDWKIQPKRRDYTWTESARLWGALLGPPSILKTPVIAACTQPIDRLDADARRRHAEAMRAYKQQLKAAKADKSGGTPEPKHPKLERYLIENTTMEALQEILREDDDAHQRAPARKVLCRHDEMSEFFANLDRYNAGGKGGGDRGAYLRLYNGGRYSVDRIGRGSFSSANWSATFLGAMQPEPIQKIAKNTAEDGLLQRFFYIVPGPQPQGADRQPGAAARDRYNALFPVLAAMHPPKTPDGEHTQVVVFHTDAQRHREAVEARAEVLALLPDTTPQLLAALGKWPGQFARLALTFHLIELADAHATGATPPYPVVISEQTTRRAAAFMLEIVLPHLLRAHRLMFSTTQTGHAQWIAGYVLAERFERITSRDVVRAYGALRAPEAKDELAAVMASLVTLGWLEPETPANPMKPVHAWLVNPAVHVRFADRAEREQDRRQKARDAIAAYLEAQKREQEEE